MVDYIQRKQLQYKNCAGFPRYFLTYSLLTCPCQYQKYTRNWKYRGCRGLDGLVESFIFFPLLHYHIMAEPRRMPLMFSSCPVMSMSLHESMLASFCTLLQLSSVEGTNHFYMKPLITRSVGLAWVTRSWFLARDNAVTISTRDIGLYREDLN